MPLPSLFSDEQLRALRFSGDYRRTRDECPTCRGTGSFKFKGHTFPCFMDDFGHKQQRLFKAFCIAQIPREFQVLDWKDFPHAAAKETIDRYTEVWPTNRMNGIGVAVYGKSMGVGKTWAATRILRQAVIHESTGYFCQFKDMAGYYELPNEEERQFRQEQLRMAECLVIDDVLAPWSTRQTSFYEDKLEETIRYRAANNLPTITTTNLVPDELEEHYPRVASILAGKQIQIELSGDDYRKTKLALDQENIELALNDEVRPIIIEEGDL